MNSFKSLLIFIFCSFLSGINAQNLHTPDAVEQYMKKSSIQYHLDTLIQDSNIVTYPLIEKGIFLVKKEDSIQILKKEYSFSKKTKKYLKKARKADVNENYSKALKFYKKANERSPDNSNLINEISDFLWSNGNYEDVVYWSQRAIENNPIDFEAHARISLAYQKIDKKEKAIDHIIEAHLLNRNHPKVIQILKEIFAENGMVYQKFKFEPEYKLNQKSEKEVTIAANEAPWLSYASCKALWQYEEKYKTQMSHLANVATSKIEQKECMLNALVAYERMKKGKENFPSLNIMGHALSNRMIDDYILYELELRQNPHLIFFLSDKKRNRIIRYLKSVRVNREVGEE